MTVRKEGSAEGSGPAAVWKLVERADEFVKYAQNRDPAKAYAQARDTLRRATEALDRLPDRAAAEGIRAQIDRRLADLDRLEAGG